MDAMGLNIGHLRKVVYSPRNSIFLLIVLIMMIGSFPRLIFAISSSYPINDGGFFYSMIEDLHNAGYSLPIYSSYNSSFIPYAYPPLSFYVGSLFADLFHWSLFDILRLFPPLISILTIPVFFLFANAYLRQTRQAIFATFVFATVPTAFDWLVMGGGLSRAPGLLFALLTLRQIYLLHNRPYHWKYVVTSICFASLTVLSHIGMAWFIFYSAGAIFLFYGRNKKGLLNSAIVFAGTLILTAPWWWNILARFGLSPFVNASGTGLFSWWAIVLPFTFLFTAEPILPIQAVLGLLGLFICIRDRRWFLPVWLFAIFLVEARMSPTFAMVPFAFLAGIALDKVIFTLLGSNGRVVQDSIQNEQSFSWKPEGIAPPSNQLGLAQFLALAYILAIGLFSSYLAAPKETLTSGLIESMQWVAANTPKESKFAVITSIPESGKDYISEWFPALTQRVSIVTPQGHEWLPNSEFQKRKGFHSLLQECSTQTTDCLERWASDTGLTFKYIYLTGDSITLQNSLRASPNYIGIYDKDGVIIFMHK
jgi:hypothetical protein